MRAVSPLYPLALLLFIWSSLRISFAPQVAGAVRPRLWIINTPRSKRARGGKRAHAREPRETESHAESGARHRGRARLARRGRFGFLGRLFWILRPPLRAPTTRLGFFFAREPDTLLTFLKSLVYYSTTRYVNIASAPHRTNLSTRRAWRGSWRKRKWIARSLARASRSPRTRT